MGRFYVFLRLDGDLVTEITTMVDAVYHSCSGFYLFLVQLDHRVCRTLLLVLRDNFSSFDERTHSGGLNHGVGFWLKTTGFVLVFICYSLLGSLGIGVVKRHFLIWFFESFLDERRLAYNCAIAYCIFLVMWGFLPIGSTYGLNIWAKGIESLIQIVFKGYIVLDDSASFRRVGRLGWHHGFLRSILLRDKLLVTFHTIAVPWKVSRIAVNPLVVNHLFRLWGLNPFFVYFHL